MKRILDVVVALFALILLAPLLALVAAAIAVEDGGPVLFRQQRTGLHGRVFTVLKFRSMSVAEDRGEVRQASRWDERVTRVGAVMRALSIDELPQLCNVLRGDMSLVGPRPHALRHDEAWGRAVPAYRHRFRTRPGLTGYAQVQGRRGEIRDIGDIVRRTEADNDYIDNWSLKLELQIILRTIPLLFHDPNAY
ncbi:MAG TPA: sugar transferase [Phenylobacterium sp.]|uniref:sugar transferase n=1 Tax=Phenylobacterium sp. TaxID=1871053 RepID=UPI002B46F85D|nr:sugar transferase [Phenylobacterium sp.]HKR88666.1 sugar transferase [Phenylobacterium sp.]